MSKTWIQTRGKSITTTKIIPYRNILQNERTIHTTYTNNSQSMLGYVYHTAFWTATKVNDKDKKDQNIGK